MCTSLDDEQTLARRSGRIGQPSVRLRDSDYINIHRIKPVRGEADNIPKRQTLIPVDEPQRDLQPNQVVYPPFTILSWENDTDSSAVRPMNGLSSAAAEVHDVLIAGGEITSSLTTATVPAETTSAIEHARKALTETSLLVSQQKVDPFFRQIRDRLGEKQTRLENDLIDEMELVWHAPDSSKPIIALPFSMLSELLALVYTLHGHAGVGATLALVRDHCHWPASARDTRLYISSCDCNRRNRSRSHKITMMPGSAVKR